MTTAAAVSTISPEEMEQLMRNTGAKNEAEAIRMAVAKVNRLADLRRLAEQFHGSLPDFMSHEQLRALRRSRIEPDGID
jgi:hypothetical protein